MYVFDLERVAFYCKQCATMVEGGVLSMPEGIMVRCHGQTEIAGDIDVPKSATKDDPHVVTVFKKAAKVASWAKRPNVMFYCKPDDKTIRHFEYQRDNGAQAQRTGRVHVFSVKCTGGKCQNREYRRAFAEDALSDKQLYGDGPPLVLDLDPGKPIPNRRAAADTRGTDADAVPASTRLPGRWDADEKAVLPPTRMIRLEEE